ncbi:prolyl hydroxylase family protein [Roseateles sp. BYS78W]|uniref:Prolyl hydroxylase family protein n=1 Tax=Pelomonas candidula TaxID=3299025 RepID=A0ABW7H884_9BURK
MTIIQHSERAFSVPGLVTPDECGELIALAERSGFDAASVRTEAGQQAMPRVRNNERTIVDESAWPARLWQRLKGIELPLVDGQSAVGLPRSLRFYKYLPGQRFKMHKDGPWREDELVSQLTLLVYLNDGFGGGCTDFRSFVVQPEAGSALLFLHDTWHEGAAVTDGVKYVLRSDVLYAPHSSTTVLP